MRSLVSTYNAQVEFVSVKDAESEFASLLKRVEAGETVIIRRNGVGIAELRPIAKNPIRLGAFEGEFDVSELTFDPLTNSEMKKWYGE